MERFYWLIDGHVAGCSQPGGRAADMARLDEDLDWLRLQGISAILSLTEQPLTEEVVRRFGLPVRHLPIPDMHAPRPEELMDALTFIDQQRIEGRAVAVHCLMGQGRTGTILAAYRIREGASADQAITELRAICPGAIESPPQVRALQIFEADRNWIV